MNVGVVAVILTSATLPIAAALDEEDGKGWHSHSLPFAVRNTHRSVIVCKKTLRKAVECLALNIIIVAGKRQNGSEHTHNVVMTYV